MSSAIGIETKAAVRRATAWGAAAACGAGDGVLVLPPTLKKTREYLADDSLGRYFGLDNDPGRIKVEGALPAYLRYDGLDLLMALAMGATGGPPTRQGTTAAYAQKFTLAGTLDGLFGTFALDNRINIDEYPTVKLSGFTIRGEVGGALSIEFQAVASDRVTGSSINTPSSFTGVTHFETSHRVLMSQGAFRMNAQAGAALGDGDRIYPSSFTLSFKRKLSGRYGLASAAASECVDEPTNDGPPEITLSLEFPRYTTKAHFEDWDAGAARKMDMVFTGAAIEGAYSRRFSIRLPNLSPAAADLPMRQGILSHPVEYACLACAAAPTGMDGILLPFQIDVVNRKSTDVLG